MTSLETDAVMAKVVCIDTLMVRRNPARSRKKSTQGAVANLEEKKRSEVVNLKNSDPKKSILRKAGEVERFGGTHHKILRTHVVRNSKGHFEALSKKVKPHERNPCATKFEERTLQETSRQEECARKAARDLARNIHKLEPEDKATFFPSAEIKTSVLVSKKTQKSVCLWLIRELSMHMLNKKDLRSDEMDTLRRSRTPRRW